MSTNNIVFLTKMMVVVIENVCGEVVKVHSTRPHPNTFPIPILIIIFFAILIIIIIIFFAIIVTIVFI